MAVQDQILQIMRFKGPLLPIKIASELKLNTTFAGAYLSELAARKLIVISHAKIGGSPVYYLKEQSSKLSMLYEHLNEKDQRAYVLLKNKKILYDKEQTPLMRVALRNIKDFAKPLTVNGKELFWKWYLLENEETEKLIKSKLGIPQLEKKEDENKNENKITPEYQLKQKQETKGNRDKLRELKEKVETEIKLKKLGELMSKKDIKEKEIKKEDKIDSKVNTKKEISSIKDKIKSIQTLKDIQSELKSPEPEDSYYYEIKSFLKEKNIEILSIKVIRRGTEIDLIIKVPSVIGAVEYFCKAKSKKKSNDGDLSSAFVQGQMKKLPVLYLTKGELTKKAQLMLEKEFKNQVVVLKWE